MAHKMIDPFSILSNEDRDQVLRAAATDVSLLLLGETGTGKGQLARAIAAHSSRPKLVEVNCAALPDELLGSELFGHKRGAFTGAVADRKGILLAAAGKTVFLDEIGEISPNMQRMLLGVVQRSNRKVKPLGSDEEIPLPPMRFIFATNRNLEEEVRAGRFREDLLRRIDIVPVRLEPLRHRKELIKGYAERFIRELAVLHNIPVTGIEPDAMKALVDYLWPGNVRELKNVIERAVVTCPRDSAVVIRKSDLVIESSLGLAPGNLKKSEADNVRWALESTGGNIKKTLEVLGLESRTALYSRMKKHGIVLTKKMRPS